MAEELPQRVRNHATGYPYTQHDHCQQWRMPDGTAFFTGWIEPGDSEHVSRTIRQLGEQIDRLNERHDLMCKIYQTVENERKGHTHESV